MAVNLNHLNPRQREAVCATAGPVLVLAGAGTGKTRVIAHRAAYLVANGVKPDQILAMTFTNKAAREMRERIAKLARPEAAKAMTIGTFHAFGARLLRQHGGKLGINPAYDIANESYLAGLVRQLLQELGHLGSGVDPEQYRARLSRIRNTLGTPETARAEAVCPEDGILADLWELYVRRLRQMDLLDFDDLLLLPLELWQRCPDLLDAHRQHYRHLMVDEYQDTNAVQFQIVRALAGSEANLCAVGDDDQSIYGWRGADIANILRFEESFPGAQVIRLEQNYRSTNTILNAANAVIAHNPRRHGKTLWSEHEAGDKILAVQAHDEEAEAKFVADLIQDWRLTRNLRPSDLAVLYRSNHQSRLLEAALRQARLPYVLVGGHSFFERKEILDGISLLQA
ncbi:MAG: UvrD-helicase domain-containing protein, partial [Lentisphaeria bacterium]